MRTLLSTLTLLSLSGCLSAKQGDALEKDSHETAAQTPATSPQYADALAKEEAVTDLCGEGGAWAPAVEAKVRAKVRCEAEGRWRTSAATILSW